MVVGGQQAAGSRQAAGSAPGDTELKQNMQAGQMQAGIGEGQQVLRGGTRDGWRHRAAGSGSRRHKLKHGLVHWKKGKSTNASRNWEVLLRRAVRS